MPDWMWQEMLCRLVSGTAIQNMAQTLDSSRRERKGARAQHNGRADSRTQGAQGRHKL